MARGRDRAPPSNASRAAPDEGDGLSQDEERDALEGIGGSGSRAGGGESDPVRDDDGTRDRGDDDDSGGGSSGRDPQGSSGADGDSDGLTDDARRNAREGLGGAGSRAGEDGSTPNIEGGDQRLYNEARRQDRQDAIDRQRNAIEGVGGAGSRAGERAPNFAGGDVRLRTVERQQRLEAAGEEAAVDFSEATRDPVGFLRGAGPQREQRFISDVTGGLSDVGADIEREFRAEVTPGEDVVTQQDVARGSQEFIDDRRDELSTAALGAVAAPEPTSTAAGAATLGLLGVAAASQRGEIDTPKERPGVFREFETPEEPGSIESELGIGQQRPAELSVDDSLGGATQSELDRPQDFGDQPDPTIVSFDRALQRGRARGRRERDEETNPFRRDDRGADRGELDDILSGGGTLGEIDEEATEPEQDVFDEVGRGFVERRDTGPGDVTAGEVGGGLGRATSAADVFADTGASFAQRSDAVGDALFQTRGGVDDALGGAPARRDSAEAALDDVGVFETADADSGLDGALDEFLGTGTRTATTPRTTTTPRQQTPPRFDDLLTPETATPDALADPTGTPNVFETGSLFSEPAATSPPAPPRLEGPSRPPRLFDDDDSEGDGEVFDGLRGVRDVEAELDATLDDEFGSVGEDIFNGEF